MKLQLTLIEHGIPVDRDDPVIPVVDTNGKLLGNLTWIQRYVGRSEIPLPHQVLLSFRGGGEAKRVFHYIWTKGFQRSLSSLKAAASPSSPQGALSVRRGHLLGGKSSRNAVRASALP